jgi:hypothetical protein
VKWRWLRRGLIATLVLVPTAPIGYLAWVQISHDTVNLPPRTGQLDGATIPHRGTLHRCSS